MLRFAAMFSLLLHLHVMSEATPSFEDLQSQLPISLTPNGPDQYFFFVVPVQKDNTPKVILQMAQVQSAEDNANTSIASTLIDTFREIINVSTSNGAPHVDTFFEVSETEDTNNFDYQVPVVVPLDFRFTYDEVTSNVALPECSMDTRTWKEKAISRISEILQLDGQPSWDHSDLNLRIRRLKDALTGVTVEAITTAEELSTFTSSIQKTKYLADIRYYFIINNITTLTGGHVSLMAEGVHTYALVIRSIEVAEGGVAKFSGDPGLASTLEVERGKIDLIKTSAESTLTKFRAALILTKGMQIEEYNADEEVY